MRADERNRGVGKMFLVKSGQAFGESHFLVQGIGDATVVFIAVLVQIHVFLDVMPTVGMVFLVHFQHVLGEMAMRSIAVDFFLESFFFLEMVDLAF